MADAKEDREEVNEVFAGYAQQDNEEALDELEQFEAEMAEQEAME